MAIDPKGEDKGYMSLSKLKSQYEDYRAKKRDEREEAEEARRYYHDDQWTAEERRKLAERNQPVVTFNMIKKKVNGIVGTLERLRQDPKAYPRTPEHEEGAEIATAVLNYVMDQNNWNAVTQVIAKDAAIEAVVGVELSIEPGDNGDSDVAVREFEPEDYFYDPLARRQDLADKRYDGIAKWVDLDVAQDMFPEHAEELRDAVTSGTGDGSEWDQQQSWTNSREKRVFLVEHWYKRGGEWFYCFYTGNLKLAEGKSEFIDHKGQTISRFITFSTSVDHDGDRYGLVRTLRGAQDEVNHRRSKGLHLLNTTRVYVTEGTIDDPEALRNELHKSDALVILPVGAKFDEKNNAAQAAGNLEMYNDAVAMLNNFGPNPVLAGEQQGEQSGRAIALLQQAALAEIGPFLLAYRDWKLRVYRAIWNIVQREWQAERWIRVTDDEGMAQFLAVNKLDFDDMGQPILANALGRLDVDIIIDEGNDNITLMQDVFDSLAQLASSGIPVPPQAMIEMADLPASKKKKLLALMEQAAAPNPAAQMAQEIQIAGEQAKVQKTQAETQKLLIEAQAKPVEAEKTMADTAKSYADAENKQADTFIKFTAPQPEPLTQAERAYQ